MHAAKLGNRVRIQYARVPGAGATLGRARAEQTSEFTVRTKEVIPNLSLGVVSMAPGDRKRLTLQPQEGYPLEPS